MVAWAPSKHSRMYYVRPAIISSTLALLFVVYLALIFVFPTAPVLIAPASSHVESSFWSLQQPAFSVPVQKLLRDLKEAARAAESEGLAFSYTAKDREQWARENPCRARLELPRLFARKHIKDVEPNDQWKAVLEEYSNLHRACIRKIGNLTDYFIKGGTVRGCKFVMGESLYGLGNRITHGASVVLYGILTQRVVLFHKWSSWIPAVMCEPFEGSSWTLPEALQYLNKRQRTPMNVNDELITNSTERFLAWVDREKANNGRAGSLVQYTGTIYLTEIDDGWQPVDRFFCDSEQEFISKVPWVSMAGCLYFLPKLFAVTSFRPTLEALFPDRMALTQVLRSVFLPYNVAWDRIQRNNDMFWQDADKRVGIQMRYRNGDYEHLQLHDSINQHIIRCLLENDILPNISYSVHNARDSKYSPVESRPSITKVLITSLHADLHDFLQDKYLRHPTMTGESVGFGQLTHDSQQRWGFEADTQALVEIILLSLSDHMLVTPLSTFGGVAQAYGGLKPWIVDHTKGDGSCVRASSVDMCYQRASESLLCPHDLDVHKKKVYDHVPYIEKCLRVDSPAGLVLITS